MASRFLLLTTLVGMLSGPCLSAGASRQMYQQTRVLLAQNRQLSDESLSVLFTVGDDRIEDLIRALDDQDEVVRKNAQVTIRYLGNEAGMNVLVDLYTRSSTYSLSGPVPLPLRDWDYRYIRENYVRGSGGWDSRATSYIYALALDGSPSAAAVLNELNSGNHKTSRHFALDRVMRNAGNAAGPMDGKLPNTVVDNAFFLSPEDRDQASARVLSFNQAKTKCLIVVLVGGIPSAETYHVVLQKYGERWKFFSVTQVAVS
jgi:HEAT repeat protein